MRQMLVFAVAVLFLAGLGFSINVSSCTNITSAGTYNLTSSVSGGSLNFYGGSYQTCMQISASNVILDCGGNTITATQEAGIEIEAPGTNVVIRNCVINDTGQGATGIEILGMQNGLITSNRFATNYTGIGGVLGGANNSNITNNNFTGAASFGIWQPGRDLLISNNRVLGYLDGIITGPSNNRVVNNYINGTTGAGILIQYSGHNISNNVIGNCTGSFSEGIIAGANPSASNFSVSNNDISFCGSHGIQLGFGSSDGDVDGATVSGNIIHDNGGDGIHVEGMTDSAISGNQIYNNDLGISLAPGFGEGFHPTSDLAVGNNNVHDNTQQGILTFFISSVNFTDNNVSSNGDSGLDIEFSDSIIVDPSVFCNNAGDGVLINQSANVNITDSLACNNTGNGVAILDSLTTLVSSNNASGNGGDGFSGSDANDTVFSFNDATNNGGSGFSVVGDPVSFSSNDALSNGGSGFSVITGNGTSFAGNTAVNNTGSGFSVIADSTAVFGGNLAQENGGSGFSVITGDSPTFSSNAALFNANSGFSLVTGLSMLLSGNTAESNGGTGFSVVSDNLTLVTSNNATNNSGGFSMVLGSSVLMTSNNARDNTDTGFSIVLGDTPLIASNLALNNSGNGFSMVMGFASLIASNNANGNLDSGFSIVTGNSSLIASNNAFSNGGDGMALSAGPLMLFASNTAFNNSGDGFDMGAGPSSIFASNNATGNGGTGFEVGDPVDSSFSGNSAFANLGDGFDILAGSNNTFAQTTAAHNGGAGFSIIDSNLTNVSGMHLYNNSPDFQVSGSGTVLEMADVVFDGPGGSFTNYTNLSISDIVASAYSIDHSDQPAPLPPNTAPLAGKFVNITEITPDASIDSITWHWLDSELTGVNEQGLRLWEFDGTWTLHGFSPDQPSNSLTATNLSNFSVFGILQTLTTSGGDEGGGGTGGNPDLSLAFNPNGNVVTVTSDGDPVPGATVKVNGSTIGTTDSNGEITFPGCGGDAFISATKSGYGPASLTGTLNPCQQCQSDLDCPANMQCVNSQCIPVPCACGTVSNHQCVAFQCCSDADCGSVQECVDHSCKDKDQCTSDSQCADTQFCDIPAGASGGSCKDVQAGACGRVTNHAFVPYGYECGTEPGCPQCPSGQSCVDHECVGGDLSCPQTGLVGDTKSCKATEDGGVCANCDYEVTDPSGKKFTGKTDGEGNFDLPLNLQGTYKVSLFKDGRLIKTIEIKALPKTPPGEEPPPTGTTTDLGTIIFLLILLLLAVLGIIYWRSRGGKKNG